MVVLLRMWQSQSVGGDGMNEKKCSMCKGKYGPIINNEVCAVCTGIIEDEEVTA